MRMLIKRQGGGPKQGEASPERGPRVFRETSGEIEGGSAYVGEASPERGPAITGGKPRRLFFERGTCRPRRG